MKLELIGEIDNLINKYSEVLDLALMGFPKNYGDALTNNR